MHAHLDAMCCEIELNTYTLYFNLMLNRWMYASGDKNAIGLIARFMGAFNPRYIQTVPVPLVPWRRRFWVRKLRSVPPVFRQRLPVLICAE